MLNTDDFIKRLEFIMDHFSLNASSFADKISVQRSSISHLLSGRNKPSLDFILKILDIFPELNLYWILDGSGTYLKSDALQKTENEVTSSPALNADENSLEEKKTIIKNEVVDENLEQLVPKQNEVLSKPNEKHIEKIVFFYTDGTFQDFKPSDIK